MDRITLLAMAPSGETFLARDRFGKVWLFQPVGAGETAEVDAGLVERAVAFGGFDRIDEQFDSWEELHQFRQDRAALVVPDVVVDSDRLDDRDVTEMLDVATRWRDAGEPVRAQRAVLALLRLPVARGDANLNERLVSFLEGLAQPPARFPSEPRTAEHRAARERYLAA